LSIAIKKPRHNARWRDRFLSRFGPRHAAVPRYIARLIDGGTHNEGRPYLVMEHARDGQPIDTYARELKLTTRAKLELFVKVCEAVQHAHQRLIVHRDLKPSNILVVPDGTPKLLDFGIAKLLDDHPEPGTHGMMMTTATGWMMMMTPDYASPEQVKGEEITVASDVYSLGVDLRNRGTTHGGAIGSFPFRAAPRGCAAIRELRRTTDAGADGSFSASGRAAACSACV